MIIRSKSKAESAEVFRGEHTIEVPLEKFAFPLRNPFVCK